MGRLDRFTLNVLCNPEVIEVDQDPLGQSAAPAILTDETFLMVNDLEDGSKAVGLFNRGEFPARVTAPWALLGLAGKQLVRDLWRQKECGKVEGEFTAEFRVMELCWYDSGLRLSVRAAEGGTTQPVRFPQ